MKIIKVFMIFKKTIFIVIFFKVINCIKLNFVNYDIYPLLFQTSIIDGDNNFKFLLDTGSPYTWISGVESESHDYYDIKNNNKLTFIKENLTETFNGGSKIVFSLYNTTFYINNVSINYIPFGITTYESVSLSDRMFDGILGLGGFSGNESIVDSYINNMITYFMVEQKIIKNNIFSLYINNTNTEYGILNLYGGEINFGEIDSSKYNGNINWYNIYDDKNIYYFWYINFNKIKINGKSFTINDKVLIDSGTSDIVLNKELCDKIHNQINATYDNTTERYIISNTEYLKDINIYLNNDKYILNSDDYTFIYNNITYSRIIINNNGNKVLGLPFLQKYYSIYDFQNKKIGLAENI